jgi:hypothetical protein
MGCGAALVKWGDGERGWDVGHSWHHTGHPGADREALNVERGKAALVRDSKVGKIGCIQLRFVSHDVTLV